MTDRSSQHWYPRPRISTRCTSMAQRWLGSICAGIQATGATGYAGVASLMRRRPGACACWKIPAWMRATHILLGSRSRCRGAAIPDDPPPDAHTFEFWRIPGRKQLTHDGKRLVLVSHWPGCCVRLALAPDLEDGSAYLYATRACAAPCARYRTLAAKLDALSAATVATPVATARSRPTPAALLELHTCKRSTRPSREPPCAGGRRSVRRGCRRGRLAQRQCIACPRTAAGTPRR